MSVVCSYASDEQTFHSISVKWRREQERVRRCSLKTLSELLQVLLNFFCVQLPLLSSFSNFSLMYTLLLFVLLAREKFLIEREIPVSEDLLSLFLVEQCCDWRIVLYGGIIWEWKINQNYIWNKNLPIDTDSIDVEWNSINIFPFLQQQRYSSLWNVERWRHVQSVIVKKISDKIRFLKKLKVEKSSRRCRFK